MDLSNIPFGVPVIVHSIRKQKNLQNPLGSKNARCLADNRDLYEQIILHRIRDDKIAIQSGHNGRFLQVRVSGECVFDANEPGEWELFTMETDWNCAIYFVSCHTGNVLHCDDNYVAKCMNQNRLDWEAWRIVEPRFAATINQMQRVSNHGHVLAGKDRQHFVLELAKCGKTPKEIEQLVVNIFDGPMSNAASSPLAVPLANE